MSRLVSLSQVVSGEQRLSPGHAVNMKQVLPLPKDESPSPGEAG